jgi:hypothetical protein
MQGVIRTSRDPHLRDIKEKLTAKAKALVDWRM